MAGETGFFTDDIDEPMNNYKRTHHLPLIMFVTLYGRKSVR